MAWAAVDLAEEGGIATDQLFEGLRFDARTLRGLKRVTWDDYCVLIERIEVLAGGGEGIVDLLEGAYHRVWPEFRSFAAALVSPISLFRFLVEVIYPVALPPVACELDGQQHGRVKVSTWLRPGARACESFFRGAIGVWCGIPRHLDLPPARAVVVDISPTHGTYELVLPEPRTLVSRARRLAGRTLTHVVKRWVPELGAATAARMSPTLETTTNPTAARAAFAVRLWKLTPRQGEVLVHVLNGLANKEIATVLGCAESTVELHMTRLLRKGGASSRTQLIARAWSL